MPRTIDQQQVVAELLDLSTKNGGILQVEKVVEAASCATSPLHEYFTWDDTEAARQFRLWEARRLIRSVTVEFLDADNGVVTFKPFVSLSTDRENPGGGYREIKAVLSDVNQRSQLLADAITELQKFQDKYANLKELSTIFTEIEKVERRFAPQVEERVSA